jgi:hypothetical protein
MAPTHQNQKQPRPAKTSTPGPSDAEVRQESAKAAQKALEAQRKADELRAAANGAADPDERQKLMEEAIDRQIEAESLGKTAKYMRKGAFQGMAVGAGLGTAPGLTLGVLTGTLVGGVTSSLLGGLGAGLGGLVGWAHGPFWNMGEAIGKGIRKVTGDLPGWKATEEQKKQLEKMIGQVNAEEMPGARELKGMAVDSRDAAQHQGRSWYNSAASYLPGSQPFASGKAGDGAWQSKNGAKLQDEAERTDERTDERTVKAVREEKGPSRTRKSQEKSSDKDEGGGGHEPARSNESQPRKQPRKLEQRSSTPTGQGRTVSPAVKRNPRKLEIRSQQTT